MHSHTRFPCTGTHAFYAQAHTVLPPSLCAHSHDRRRPGMASHFLIPPRLAPALCLLCSLQCSVLMTGGTRDDSSPVYIQCWAIYQRCSSTAEMRAELSREGYSTLPVPYSAHSIQ
eukprot:2164965-Rhodomonas_salina.1